jgi:carotenoid 1,2-hydratase
VAIPLLRFRSAPADGPGPLAFDAPVPPDGYRWWYLDALAEGGGCGLTVIAFVGSVFSPYYAWARRRGPADPENHCALNVALYGPRNHRWAMTERRREHVVRSPDAFGVGPSRVDWDGSCLTISVDEWTVPVPSKLRGRIRVWPRAPLGSRSYALDANGLHRWTPFAPHARVEVDFRQPDLQWHGTGYFDSNAGDEPLERGFSRWTWSRADLGADAAVLYDVERRDGGRASLALRFGPDDAPAPFEPPPEAPLARARIWRMPRGTRSEGANGARVVATFEDTPFYARSLVESRLLGSRVLSMHESLDLSKFSSPVVQAMLPFRMPRALSSSRAPAAVVEPAAPSSAARPSPTRSPSTRSRRSDQSS